MQTSNLFSHPNRLLEDHIKGVCAKVRLFAHQANISPTLQKLLLIIAFAHDLGKATSFFQRYLLGEKQLKKDERTKHALLGGVIALHLALKEGIQDPLHLALAFLLPKRHHGDLHSFDKDLLLSPEQIAILQEQIEAIDKEAFEKLLDNIGLFSFSLDEIDFNKIRKRLQRLKIAFRKDQKELLSYLETLTLFSILIDSDKLDATLQDDYHFDTTQFSPELVTNYLQKQNIPKTKLNDLRQEALKEVLSQPYQQEQRVYDLTLPTGMGKTLISFAFALKLAKSHNTHIIYALPFLSIIEQNYEVIKSVLEANGITPTSEVLLKHHHLTELLYKSNEEEFDYDRSRVLIEGWQSQIVVTTFVQFFHTLIGYQNKMVRKFHRLTNAVVILDEVQSIPSVYWPLIRALIAQLAKKFNFYVIFVTATQPMILEHSCALVDKDYFSHFNRYRIIPLLEPKRLDIFLPTVSLQPQKRYLFILNTIAQAKEFYTYFKQFDPVLLTTHIIPKERKKRISALKNSKIAIATQLIEAGVDVDFDVVFRDLAPFDSIIQSAGRCNREAKRSQGEVFITNLIDDNGRSFASYIYDSTLLATTQEIISKGKFEEKEVLEKIEEYFNLLQQRKSFFESKELLQAIQRLDFDALKNFQLIKERVDLVDVFVQTDKEGVAIWQEFCKIMQIEDLFEKKAAFAKIKARFYDYVISVPIKDNEPPIECGHYVVYLDDLQNYYDLDTGFITKRSFEIL